MRIPHDFLSFTFIVDRIVALVIKRQKAIITSTILENYLNDKKLKFDIKAYLPDFLEDPSASGQTHKASYQDSDSENDEDEVLTHKFQEIKLTYVDSGILLNYFCFSNHCLGFLSLLPLTSLKSFLFQMMKMRILPCQATTNGIQ